MKVMGARTPFGIGEWYHCYSRGVDKRATFQDERDFERFMQSLYLANDSTSLRHEDIAHPQDFLHPRSQSLVAIAAYTLMPNHYHLVLREICDGGITAFMRKLGIAYTTYFNTKYERIGNLFVKPFRAKHIDSDVYLQHTVHYTHLNPVELFEPGWKKGCVVDKATLIEKLLAYPYSSLADYEGFNRPSGAILDMESMKAFNPIPLEVLIRERGEWYEDFAESNEP